MPADKLGTVTFPPSVSGHSLANLYRVVRVHLIDRYTVDLPINHDLASTYVGFVLRCCSGVLKAADICPCLCKGLVHYIYPGSMNNRFDRSDSNNRSKHCLRP